MPENTTLPCVHRVTGYCDHPDNGAPGPNECPGDCRQREEEYESWETPWYRRLIKVCRNRTGQWLRLHLSINRVKAGDFSWTITGHGLSRCPHCGAPRAYHEPDVSATMGTANNVEDSKRQADAAAVFLVPRIDAAEKAACYLTPRILSRALAAAEGWERECKAMADQNRNDGETDAFIEAEAAMILAGHDVKALRAAIENMEEVETTRKARRETTVDDDG